MSYFISFKIFLLFFHIFLSGTSVWEVEVKDDRWKVLDVDTSMFLEDSWKNDAEHARYENKIEVFNVSSIENFTWYT